MKDEINKKLLDNSFSRKLSADNYEALTDLQKREGFDLNQNNHHLLNENEKYVYRITKLHNNLIETIEQLEFIIIFLRRYPNKDFYSKNNIDQLNYIQYHTETLLFKVHTVQEIMKLLVNEVYNLGLKPKLCSWKTLVSKLGKSNSSLKVIDKYYHIFENLIESRHLNSHRGIFEDKEQDKINLDFGYSVYKLYNRLDMLTDSDFIKAFPKFLIDFKIKEHKKKRIELVKTVQSRVYEITKEFLLTLQDEYLQNIK